MRVYLDMWALKRPFDDIRDERTRLEALAVAAIFDAHRHAGIELVSSADPLEFIRILEGIAS